MIQDRTRIFVAFIKIQYSYKIGSVHSFFFLTFIYSPFFITSCPCWVCQSTVCWLVMMIGWERESNVTMLHTQLHVTCLHQHYFGKVTWQWWNGESSDNNERKYKKRTSWNPNLRQLHRLNSFPKLATIVIQYHRAIIKFMKPLKMLAFRRNPITIMKFNLTIPRVITVDNK